MSVSINVLTILSKKLYDKSDLQFKSEMYLTIFLYETTFVAS